MTRSLRKDGNDGMNNALTSHHSATPISRIGVYPATTPGREEKGNGMEHLGGASRDHLVVRHKPSPVEAVSIRRPLGREDDTSVVAVVLTRAGGGFVDVHLVEGRERGHAAVLLADLAEAV